MIRELEIRLTTRVRLAADHNDVAAKAIFERIDGGALSDTLAEMLPDVESIATTAVVVTPV